MFIIFAPTSIKKGSRATIMSKIFCLWRNCLF